jgi:hypothetical protein
MTYFFALAHEEAEYCFIGALKRGVVESEDIRRYHDKQRARKCDYGALR